MNAKKIVETFEKRKNVTKKAMSDLKEIFKWVEKVIDRNTFLIEKDIHLKASWYMNNSNLAVRTNGEDRTFYLGMIDGDCGIFQKDVAGYHFLENEYNYISLDKIDRINLKELQESLFEFLNELEKFSTREESASKIAAIAKLLK